MFKPSTAYQVLLLSLGVNINVTRVPQKEFKMQIVQYSTELVSDPDLLISRLVLSRYMYSKCITTATATRARTPCGSGPWKIPPLPVVMLTHNHKSCSQCKCSVSMGGAREI